MSEPQQHAVIARPWSGRSTMVAAVRDDEAGAEKAAADLRDRKGEHWEFWVQPVQPLED